MSENVEQSEELIEIIEEQLDEQHLKLGIVDIDDLPSNADDKTSESSSQLNRFQYQMAEQQSPAIAVRTDQHEQNLLSDDEMKELTTLEAVPTKVSTPESVDETTVARQQLEALAKTKRKGWKSAENTSENEQQPQSESSAASRLQMLSSVVISTPNPSKNNQNGTTDQTPNRPIPNDKIPGTIEIPKELILGNADVSSPLIDTTDANASRTIQNEDLIAILEGGDDESPVTFDSNAVSEVLRTTVSAAVPAEKPTPVAATAAKVSSPVPKTPIGPLTKDLERRIAMEQMMALPGKRQGRKQKLVAKEGSVSVKKSAASDLVSSLVSEWSDNESKSDTNDIAVAVDDVPAPPPAVVVSKKPPKTVSATEPPVATSKKQLNAVPMPSATFKRSRIIKKKIIWDPDAPETAISYASLVSPSSQPVKKRPKIEKETPQSLPAAAASSSQQPAKSTNVVVKQKPLAGIAAKSDAPKTKREPNVKSLAKKRASSDSPSSMNRRKKITEIDRLLGDEGAVNMLNALKKKNNDNGATADDTSDTESTASETRSSKAATTAAATIITNEKLEASQPKAGKQRTISAPKQSPTKKEAAALKKRNPKKKSSAASSWDYIYSGSCDDSMIIRRRSNSSYSSTTSPIRLSVELTPTSTTATPTNTAKLSTSGSGSKISSKTAKVTKEKFEFAKPNAKKVTKDKRTAIIDHSIVNDLSEANADSTDSMARRSKRGHLPISIVDDIETDTKSGGSNTGDGLIKLEQNCYEELLLKRHKHFVEILLAPESNKNENVLTITLMKNVTEVLTNLSNDNSCKLVLLLSANDTFCNGLDYSTLIQTTTDKRKSSAKELCAVVKNFFLSIATFKKPIIVGVSGHAIGIGVTMLPLFDMVFASDKALFETVYSKIGQIPEGCSILSATNRLTEIFKNELSYQSDSYTVTYAQTNGLVTKISNADSFHVAVIKRCERIALQSLQSLEASKSVLQCEFIVRLQKALPMEQTHLIQNWTSAECQEKFKKILNNEKW